VILSLLDYSIIQSEMGLSRDFFKIVQKTLESFEIPYFRL